MKIGKILQLASLLVRTSANFLHFYDFLIFSISVQIMYMDFIVATPLQQTTCGNAYGQKPCVFLPAPSGHTPKCAKPGSTFCEHVEDYPE